MRYIYKRSSARHQCLCVYTYRLRWCCAAAEWMADCVYIAGVPSSTLLVCCAGKASGIPYTKQFAHMLMHTGKKGKISDEAQIESEWAYNESTYIYTGILRMWHARDVSVFVVCQNKNKIKTRTWILCALIVHALVWEIASLHVQSTYIYVYSCTLIILLWCRCAVLLRRPLIHGVCVCVCEWSTELRVVAHIIYIYIYIRTTTANNNWQLFVWTTDRHRQQP